MSEINEMSQAQVIGRPKMRTWDDYEQGCLDTFAGGHRSDGMLGRSRINAFQHGMRTVFSLLRNEFPPAELCKQAGEIERLRNALLECHRLVCTKDDCCLDGGPEHDRAFNNVRLNEV